MGSNSIVFVIRNGLWRRDVLPSYEPHKTIYNRFIRWNVLGVFRRIFVELARSGAETESMMIDATRLKAHRTAASLLKKGLFPGISGAPEVAQTQSCMRSATEGVGQERYFLRQARSVTTPVWLHFGSPCRVGVLWSPSQASIPRRHWDVLETICVGAVAISSVDHVGRATSSG